MELKKRIAALRTELVSLRRDFHRHPELGFQEFRTAEKVEHYLSDLGIPCRRMAGTGVVGLLEGGKAGPVLLLRADMDALPVREENDIPYRSQNEGVMHACGHDAHTAMLLVAARLLAERQKSLAGSVKLVFQPNEETVTEPTGAAALIEAGVLKDPRVDAALALHIWTPLGSGTIGTAAGAVTATLSVFKIVVKGKGGHTGFPEGCVDPIFIASAIVTAVQSLQTREISLLKPTIVMFGKIAGGTKSNIVPDHVVLEGSLRYLYAGGESSEENPEGRFRRIVEGIVRTHRGDCDIDIHVENKAVVNDPRLTKLAAGTAAEVLGDREKVLSYACTAGEDFSEFSARVPSCLYFLGTGNARAGSEAPHHNPGFNIDEDTLPLGVEMHVRSALNYLSEEGG
jgi:amidohydrolase